MTQAATTTTTCIKNTTAVRMESYTPPPADLAPIPHLSLCVNFQSFFSFWTACGAPSIEVDTTEQQVARHNQPNIYIRTTNRQQHTEIQYL